MRVRQTLVVLVLGSVFAAVLAGCGATESQLRSRAAFDLGCGEQSINIIEIDSRTRGVRGCDKQATYVEQCASPNKDCTWVLNSDSRQSSETASTDSDEPTPKKHKKHKKHVAAAESDDSNPDGAKTGGDSDDAKTSGDSDDAKRE